VQKLLFDAQLIATIEYSKTNVFGDIHLLFGIKAGEVVYVFARCGALNQSPWVLITFTMGVKRITMGVKPLKRCTYLKGIEFHISCDPRSGFCILSVIHILLVQQSCRASVETHAF
jgi:hypothetical protein